jgi:NAD(P)-dependent dehydrogenase (short-subunit alcohol dehydrogenase family)
VRAGPFDLTGTVSIVTGGSRGIGRALAVGLAMAGSDVVVASRKLANCQQVADQIEHQTGRRALAVAYHAGQWEESDRLVETVYAEFGRCDVLVNNAGTAPAYEDLCSVSEALWTKVHQVNAMGPFRLGALIGARMAGSEDGGSIINVSSVAAVRPSPDNVVYAMSKAALDSLTLGLAACYGPKVRVNGIYPEVIATDMTGAWDRLEETVKSTGRDRVGQPDDLIGTCVFLASQASKYVTGSVISVA